MASATEVRAFVDKAEAIERETGPSAGTRKQRLAVLADEFAKKNLHVACSIELAAVEKRTGHVFGNGERAEDRCEALYEDLMPVARRIVDLFSYEVGVGVSCGSHTFGPPVIVIAI